MHAAYADTSHLFVFGFVASFLLLVGIVYASPEFQRESAKRRPFRKSSSVRSADAPEEERAIRRPRKRKRPWSYGAFFFGLGVFTLVGVFAASSMTFGALVIPLGALLIVMFFILDLVDLWKVIRWFPVLAPALVVIGVVGALNPEIFILVLAMILILALISAPLIVPAIVVWSAFRRGGLAGWKKRRARRGERKPLTEKTTRILGKPGVPVPREREGRFLRPIRTTKAKGIMYRIP